MTETGPDKGALNSYRRITERLVLEVPNFDDAPDLFGLVGGEDRAEVTAGLIWDGPDEVSETLDFIRRCQTEAFDDFGFHWALKDRTGAITGQVQIAMGMIGTRPRGEPGRADVGYWLGRPYWGRGLMREALTSVLDLCFGDLKVTKVEADIFTDNVRSVRLAEGVGMKREGTIRRAHRKGDSWVDAHIYGLLNEEWVSVPRLETLA